MANKYGFSDLECKIILDQIERRAKYRKEFLKLRTDPCKHTQQAGYVFDKAIQHFLSMKTCQLEYFQFNPTTITIGLLALAPMFTFGYVFWRTRTDREREIRCGRLKYKDRRNKLA
ncbi:hypothetical protein SFRURICE_016848 [Spodoptera frugiperda]|uniref:NADH dehydrogenase [ubiquinone] 1 beta subcomplex subunit 4 n=1 Tax=Spodoptera frugiperda TaxID=7108 RepID=A0A2H1W9G6_SPOFR|nr:NDUFB4-like protein [Spodoptera frugiperda]KAF9824739.1 hypothetical protein SFRURICE_016848 [Spodoptera frugiperda]